MKTHIKYRGDRPYRCEFCKMTFVTSSHLKKHHLVHTGEKPHACHVCGTCFSKANNLKRHLLIHTGDRPFVCRECGDAFTTNGDMKRHVRTHTGEKPFTCRFCPAAYNQAGHLRRHELSHAANVRHAPFPTIVSDRSSRYEEEREAGEDKRYSCRYCVAVFTQVGHLQRHELNHRKAGPQRAQNEEEPRRRNKPVRKGADWLKSAGEEPYPKKKPEMETPDESEQNEHQDCSDQLTAHPGQVETPTEVDVPSEPQSRGAVGVVDVGKDKMSRSEKNPALWLHCDASGTSRSCQCQDAESESDVAKPTALPVFPEREIPLVFPQI